MREPVGGRVGVDGEVVARCLATLRRTPAALVTDIDGTISAIAATPAEATVDPVARDALRRLTERVAVVAVVSGRAAAVGAEMVGVPGVIYIGNHGMEKCIDGKVVINLDAAEGARGLAAALAEVEAGARAAGQAEGMLIEDKRLSGTVHYRLAPDAAAARATLLPLVAAAADRHGLVVTEGRLIIEIRPNVVVNKGTAIVELVKIYGLRGVVFLGDDLTDVDGFVALRTLREAGAVETLRVGVVGPETPARVREEVDVSVGGVPAGAALLAAVADGLAPDTADGG